MRHALACLLLLACQALAEETWQVLPDWPKLPAEGRLGVCAGVGVDANHRVFVFHRSGRKWSNPFPSEPIAEPTVSVFDGTTGALLDRWGAGRFIMPHGLTLDAEGNVWLTDVGLHQVFKCSPRGEILLTLGEAGVRGADRTHFNLPSDVAVLPDGSFYVSDGYKNTRVVKFSAAGRYEFEWGTPGSGPGEFNLPHDLAVDAGGRVYVCDRENLRLQVFDARGQFLAQWQGPQIGKPYGVDVAPNGRVLVIDGGQPSLKPAARGKAVILDAEGRVQVTIGSAGSAPGQFQLGHDIAAGPDGVLYVAEGAGERVQKFVRVSAPAAP
jgi:peptidylamidoglycolate lyase